jgi:hypothetical protein
MPRSLAELFTEIAKRASEANEPILADLCRMAALVGTKIDIPLDWDWDSPDVNGIQHAALLERCDEVATATSGAAAAKTYQVWSRRGTGMYSVTVAGAKGALATFEELSAARHSDISVRDMEGNEIEIEVIRVIVAMEANPSIRLVPR